MTEPTDVLLQERGITHGDYKLHAKITQSIKDFYRSFPNWGKMTVDQRETMDMIAHKQGRILAGNPEFADHWDDIAGYARLSGNEVRARIPVEPASPEPPTNATILFVANGITVPEDVAQFIVAEFAPEDWRSLVEYATGMYKDAAYWPSREKLKAYAEKLRHAATPTTAPGA